MDEMSRQIVGIVHYVMLCNGRDVKADSKNCALCEMPRQMAMGV